MQCNETVLPGKCAFASLEDGLQACLDKMACAAVVLYPNGVCAVAGSPPGCLLCAWLAGSVAGLLHPPVHIAFLQVAFATTASASSIAASHPPSACPPPAPPTGTDGCSATAALLVSATTAATNSFVAPEVTTYNRQPSDEVGQWAGVQLGVGWHGMMHCDEKHRRQHACSHPGPHTGHASITLVKLPSRCCQSPD